MTLEEEQLERLRTASDLLATARLAGMSYLETRKRAREAMVRASEAGCSDTSISKALGVTRLRVQQILEQEEMRAEMSDEDYDKLVMSFPPAALTSVEHEEWSAKEVHDRARARFFRPPAAEETTQSRPPDPATPLCFNLDLLDVNQTADRPVARWIYQGHRPEK